MNNTEQIDTLKFLIMRFSFYHKRFLNFKSLYISAKACSLELPPGIIEKAGEALIDKMAMRRKLTAFKEEYDLFYLEQKMNGFVLAEKYEKAAIYRDKINQYKEKYGRVTDAQKA